MKLLFICSSLAPGESGVGDYVRQLATSLRLLNNQVVLFSINDKTTCFNIQAPDEQSIRLSASLSLDFKLKVLRAYCSSFEPDWISLQYVPYSFDRRGLPLRLPFRLKGLCRSAKWHIMFHELWIYSSKNSKLRHKLVSFLQRQAVKNLSLCLQPAVVHTSNPLYSYLLGQLGIVNTRLPLFSGINVEPLQYDWFEHELLKLGIDDSRDKWFFVGMFGSIYPGYPLEIQVGHAASLAESLGKKVAFFGIGGGVGTGSSWEDRILNAIPTAIVCHFGRQIEGRIASMLSNIDLGLPCTPYEVLGKSSVVAAMAHYCAAIDTSYTAEWSEFSHLGLNKWPPKSLFWPFEQVVYELNRSLGSS